MLELGLPTRRKVQALRDCAHDEVLDHGPVLHHLLIADPDDVVTHQLEFRIMSNIFASLCSDVSRTINLEYQSIPDERVDTMASDPGLDVDRELEPPQTYAKIGLESSIRERLGLGKDSPGRGAQRQPRHCVKGDELPVERGLPGRECLFEGLAVSDDSEHVLYRIFQDPGFTRYQWLRPVHANTLWFTAGAPGVAAT